MLNAYFPLKLEKRLRLKRTKNRILSSLPYLILNVLASKYCISYLS